MADSKVADTANVLQLLWRHFDAARASDEDLDFLTNISEEVSVLAHATAETAFSAANSACEDREAGRNFTSVNGTDVQSYLLQVANTLSVIGQLSIIAGDAAYVRNARITAKANAKSRRVVVAEQSSFAAGGNGQ